MPNLDGKVKVFGCYHAGGNINAYVPWAKRDSSIAFIPVELSGHGRRRREPLPSSISQIAQQLAEDILNVVEDGEEFVLWGHSMGSAVAYETCRYLELYYGNSPTLLVVSSRQPPVSDFKGLYQCSQGLDALVDDIRRLGTIPEEMLQNRDFLEYAIPTIYHDYYINEQYTGNYYRLNTPIVAHYATDDIEAPKKVLSGWKDFTNSHFEIKSFKGGHFYIFDEDVNYYHALESTVNRYLHKVHI
jgi:surfactin synthase thioesterase subunit